LNAVSFWEVFSFFIHSFLKKFICFILFFN
jgi:hypothetical protein